MRTARVENPRVDLNTDDDTGISTCADNPRLRARVSFVNYKFVEVLVKELPDKIMKLGTPVCHEGDKILLLKARRQIN